MFHSHRRRGASVVTLAAIVGALALPNAAFAEEAAPSTATPTPTVTSTPTPTPSAEATAAPVPVATAAPTAAAAAPTLIVADSFAVGSDWEAWGENGLVVHGDGFAPSSVPTVELWDAGVLVNSEQVNTTDTGIFSTGKWYPTDSSGHFVGPHLSLPGEAMVVVARGANAAGESIEVSKTLTVVRTAPSLDGGRPEDSYALTDGGSYSVLELRRRGAGFQYSGFDRDEDVRIGLTAPDGSTSVPATSPEPLYGSGYGNIYDALPAQLGRFVLSATGVESGLTATLAFTVTAVTVPELVSTRSTAATDPAATATAGWPASAAASSFGSASGA